MKWIVNQDKNCAVKFEEVNFKIVYKYYCDVEIGCNLYYRNILLGSFLDIEECLIEVFKILIFSTKVYEITNYI